MKSCTEIAPTFISLGNHEWILADEDISAMVSTGVHVLDNRWVEYQINGHRILIGGLTSVFVDNYREFRNTQKSRYPVPPMREKPRIKIRIVAGFQSLKNRMAIRSCYHTIRNIGVCGNQSCARGRLTLFSLVMHTVDKSDYLARDSTRQDRVYFQSTQKVCGWERMDGLWCLQVWRIRHQ